MHDAPPGLRRAIGIVAALNLGFFGIEFAVALTIASVALFADSIDFLEDGAVNVLILLALSWGARARARTGMILAAILFAPGIATAWTVVSKIQDPVPPEAIPLTMAGAAALLVNTVCALLLAKHRHHPGSLVRAAFLSARNDVAANLGILAAAGLTVATRSIWPDLVVGIGIFAMNLGAAREVFTAARREHAEAKP